MADVCSIKPKNILIACTGSVATIKLPLLLDLFKKEFCFNGQIELSVIVTERAKHFFVANDVPLGIKIYSDEDEWENWKKRGDPVLHIELAKWADAMIIAPLDANTLAKISQGICDNLLTCTARAWIVQKPLFFCPAMNTKMWEHPITSQQIEILKRWGYIEIPSIEKTLMCGDTGMGAMAEISTIVENVKKHMSK